MRDDFDSPSDPPHDLAKRCFFAQIPGGPKERAACFSRMVSEAAEGPREDFVNIFAISNRIPTERGFAGALFELRKNKKG